VSSLRKTLTRQRRSCDLNPGATAPESSTLTTRLPSHQVMRYDEIDAEAIRYMEAALVVVTRRIVGTQYTVRSASSRGLLRLHLLTDARAPSSSPPRYLSLSRPHTVLISTGGTVGRAARPASLLYSKPRSRPTTLRRTDGGVPRIGAC